MSEKPLMWKVDPLADRQAQLEVSIVLHREAGRSGFACVPQRSHIDKRYFAEINKNELRDDGRYVATQFNIAMGTGDTPLEAAADGYRRVVPLDDMMAVLYLEAETALLTQVYREAAEKEEREARQAELAVELDETLFQLRHALSMVWGRQLPLTGETRSVIVPDPFCGRYNEDDDL